MHTTRWTDWILAKALYFSYSLRLRLPTQEIENQKYRHDIFMLSALCTERGIDLPFGQEPKPHAGALCIFTVPRWRPQMTSKRMRSTCLGLLGIFSHQLVFTLVLVSRCSDLMSLHLSACRHNKATGVCDNFASLRADFSIAKKQRAFGQLLRGWAIFGKRISSHLRISLTGHGIGISEQRKTKERSVLRPIEVKPGEVAHRRRAWWRRLVQMCMIYPSSYDDSA